MIRTLNRVGALAGIIFLLSASDAFVAGHRSPLRSFRGVRGEKISVSGIASRKVASTDQLRFRADNPLLDMGFQSVDGAAWNGELYLPDALRAGEYHFRVDAAEFEGKSVANALSDYQVHVFANATDYHAASFSMFEKFFGVSPRKTMGVAFSIMLASLALAFRRSMRQEAELNARGVASIFRVAQSERGREINFGLGSRHGVSEGDVFGIMDSHRHYLGSAVVVSVRAEYCSALADADAAVRRNDLVYRWDGDRFRAGDFSTVLEPGEPAGP